MRTILFLATCCALPLFSCAAPPPSAATRQQLQARDFAADKTSVYRSCMRTLQDAGYVIQSADFEAGLITAYGEPAQAEGFWETITAPDRIFASVVLDPHSPSTTEVRATFVEHDDETDCEGVHTLDVDTIYTPEVYATFFQGLDRVLATRRGS